MGIERPQYLGRFAVFHAFNADRVDRIDEKRFASRNRMDADHGVDEALLCLR